MGRLNFAYLDASRRPSGALERELGCAPGGKPPAAQGSRPKACAREQWKAEGHQGGTREARSRDFASPRWLLELWRLTMNA